MYHNKYLKYKIKYKNIIKNKITNSYSNIENVLNNLDKHYVEIKDIQRSKSKVLYQKGGSKMKQYDDKKIHKYKKFIKQAKSTIKYYKNVADQYYVTNITLNNQYYKLVNLLKAKKEDLERMSNQLNILGISNNNNKDKIQLLDTTIGILSKSMKDQDDIDLNLQIKSDKGNPIDYKILNLSNKNLIGGDPEMDAEEFSRRMNESIETAKQNIRKIEEDTEFVNEKVTKVFNTLVSFEKDTDKLQKISLDIEILSAGITNKTADNIDFKKIFNEFNTKILAIKSESTSSEKLADMLGNLEKLANKFNLFIESNKKTLSGLDSKTIKEMDNFVETVNLSIEQIKNGQPVSANPQPTPDAAQPTTEATQPVQSGGQAGGRSVKDIYEEKLKKELETLKRNLDSENKLKYYIFNYDEVPNLNTDFSVYSNIISIINLVSILEYYLELYYKVEKVIPNTLKNKQNIVQNLDLLFKKKNTDFYKKLLKKKVYNIIISDSDIVSLDLTEINKDNIVTDQILSDITKYKEPTAGINKTLILKNIYEKVIIRDPLEEITTAPDETEIESLKLKNNDEYKKKILLLKIIDFNIYSDLKKIIEIKKIFESIEQTEDQDIEKFKTSLNKLESDINKILNLLLPSTEEYDNLKTSISELKILFEKFKDKILDNKDKVESNLSSLLTEERKISQYIIDYLSIKNPNNDKPYERPTEKKFDIIMGKINDSIVFVTHLLYVYISIYKSLLESDGKTDTEIYNYYSDLFEKLNELQFKSYIYNQPEKIKQTGGIGQNALVPFYKSKIELNEIPEEFNFSSKDNMNAYAISAIKAIGSLTIDKNNPKFTVKSLMTKDNLSNLESLMVNIKLLYEKICRRLKEESFSTTDQTEETNFDSLYKSIKTLIEQEKEQSSNNESLKTYKKNIKLFIDKSSIINKLIINKLDIKEDLEPLELNSLVNLYAELNKQYTNGTKYYMNSFSIILLSSEVNATSYTSDKYKYLLSYDKDKELVTFKLNNFPDNPNIPSDNWNPNYFDLTKQDYRNLTFKAHDAFFESNGKSTNESIFTAPIIGTDKLSEVKSEDIEFVNPVLMTLLTYGSTLSETTLKLFGGGDGGDKKGIINKIVEKYLKDGYNAEINFSITYGQKIGKQSDTVVQIVNNPEGVSGKNKASGRGKGSPVPAPVKKNTETIGVGNQRTPEISEGNTEKLIKTFESSGQSDTGKGFTPGGGASRARREALRKLGGAKQKNNNFDGNDLTEIKVSFDYNKIKSQSSVDNDKYIPYIQKSLTQSDKTDLSTLPDFYGKLMSKKLIKCTYLDFKDFIEKGEPINDGKITELLAKQELSFRAMLKQSDFWYKLKSNDISKELSDIFIDLDKEQKKIQTILPTMDNINCPRCPSTFIIKLTKNQDIKYIIVYNIPLPEDINKTAGFLYNTEIDKEKLFNVIKTINNITKEDTIVTDVEPNRQSSINSADLLLKEDKIAKYVKLDSTPVSRGGGIMKVNDINLESFNDNDTDIDNFYNKIINEGHYINHTVAILLLVQQINSNILQSNFDNNLDEGFKEKILKLISINKSGPTEDKKNVNLLIDDLSYNNLLNQNSIWLQDLFCFLYWNHDNKESTDNETELKNQMERIKSKSVYPSKPIALSIFDCGIHNSKKNINIIGMNNLLNIDEQSSE